MAAESERSRESGAQDVRHEEDDEEELREPRRLSKPDLLMAVAFWMENSPLAEQPSDFLDDPSSTVYKKTGAVLLLPNDRALSVDFSHDGTHAAINALNKFGHEKAKGCQVFLSRRPCSLCAKLLIQCEVAKVFYLPIEPELDDREDAIRVDTMFLSSNCGLSIKVPKIDKCIFQDLRKSPYMADSSIEVEQNPFFKQLVANHWSQSWEDKAKESLRWHAFDGLKKQITKDMKSLFKWIVHTTVLAVSDNILFQEIKKTPEGNLYHQTSKPEESPGKTHHAPIQESKSRARKRLSLDAPASDSDQWQNFARHSSRLAQMLSQRSDDPIRGVGCVLTIHSREIVAIGWNGFPAKALYGEYPRREKEPFVIHAEQNALLTRNKRNLKEKTSVLFVNEVPCIQCLPILKQAGVNTLVIPKINADGENQDHLVDLALKKEFSCFGSKHKQN